MRLPGTTNWPDAKKRDRGRVPAEARTVELHTDTEHAYELRDFDASLSAEQPSTPRAATSKEIDWSDDLLAVGKDKRAGKSNATILEKHRTHPHAQTQPDPDRAVWRCIEKVESDREAELLEMNRQHAIVWMGGDAVVVIWPHQLENGVPRICGLAALRTWYANAPNPRLVDNWLTHARRSQFNNIVFEPGVETATDFNLWRGWSMTPRAGDCSLQVAHIRDVLCAGDESLFEYVIQWLANIFQQPRNKPLTALVLYGGEGIGKGALYRMLEPLLFPHCVPLAGSDLLLGRFNDFYAGKLLTFGDEAAWPGDKRGLDKLRSFISEKRITIERKHVSAFQISSHCRFIVATNRDRAAPAALDDRRFVVLPVNPQHRDDYAYWQALADEQTHGGSAALLHHLLHEVKITRNLFETPKTAALAEQKLLNLDTFGAFWRAMLMREAHTLEQGAGANTNHLYVTFGRAVKTETLHDFYLHYCQRMRDHIRCRSTVWAWS